MRKFIIFITLLLNPVVSGLVWAAPVNETIVAGWLEKIVIEKGQLKLKAKLDTGAKTSSIHAKNIERFEQDGKPWVRFTLPKAINAKKNEKRLKIELPVVRDALIKRHGLPSKKRPVVKLAFCIHDHYYEAEFTLANRAKFLYPVLLGRRFLSGNILVDAGSTYLHDVDIKGYHCDSNVKEQVAVLFHMDP